MTSFFNRHFGKTANGDSRQERLGYWRGVTAQYGSEIVPVVQVHDEFANLVQCNFQNFVFIRQGLYGKQITPEIVHLVKLQAYKGGRYSIRWGVSLSFVPSHWSPSLKFHRTIRSARFDLFEDPVLLIVSDTAPAEEEAQVYVSTVHGIQYFRHQMETMWSKCESVIPNWFENASDLPGILTITNRQIQNKPFGGYAVHAPRPKMIASFILARMGKTEQALTSLLETANDTLETPDAIDRLKDALKAASSLHI